MNAPRRSHNLPAAVTALIGRERELAAARPTLLDTQVRLVTLTGAPGTGKTRLALAVAEDVRPAFEDGVWFVPLASSQRSDLVLPTIAQVLGVRPIGRRPVVEALRQALADQRVLLVLDNFEQVLAAGRGLLEMLEACPGQKIMSTSRARLRLSGEHQLPVPALELPAPRSTTDSG
jgi:predicted ATPase